MPRFSIGHLMKKRKKQREAIINGNRDIQESNEVIAGLKRTTAEKDREIRAKVSRLGRMDDKVSNKYVYLFLPDMIVHYSNLYCLIIKFLVRANFYKA